MPAAVRSASPWIRSPLWDGFWILSALWLAPLALWLAHGSPQPWTGDVDVLLLVLTAAFWVGHRISSTYLAYCTSAYRPVLRAQPIRFVLLPIAITAGVFLFLLLPERWIPLSFARRTMVLFILDVVLVTWHFAAQHYGLLAFYRVRAGQTRTSGARLADRFFAIGIGGVVVLLAEIVAGEVAFRDVWIDPVFPPDWLEAHHATLVGVGVAVVGVATAAMLVREALDPRRSLPRAAYLLGIGGTTALAFLVHPFLFLLVWTSWHWMAATGLASLAATGGAGDGTSPWYRFWGWINRRPALVVVLLGTLSVLLLPVMEVEAMEDPALGYGPRLFPFLGNRLADPGLLPILIALGLTTAFVHYALDRAVWRLSDPAVRHAARGALARGGGRPTFVPGQQPPAR